MVTRIKIRVVVPLTVIFLVCFCGLCESNSFFQVSNDQDSLISSINFRRNSLNKPVRQHVNKDKHSHNYGDDLVGQGKRIIKGHRNRSGRKKSRKHHKKRNNTQEGVNFSFQTDPLHIVKNADVEAFNLQDLKSDKTEFSFPVLDNAAPPPAEKNHPFLFVPSPKKLEILPESPLQVSNHAASSIPDSVVLKSQPPVNLPKLQPQKSHIEAFIPSSSVSQPKKPEPEVKPAPNVQVRNIPQTWVRNDLKIEDVPEDALIPISQEKRSNLVLSNVNDSLSTGNGTSGQGFGTGSGIGRAHVGAESRNTLLDFPWDKPHNGHEVNENSSQEKYDELCKTKENLQQQKRCIDEKGDSELEVEARAAAKSLDFDNLIGMGEDRQLPNQIKARHLHNVDQQNQKLAIATLTHAVFQLDEELQEPQNGFKLLDKSKSIFAKICPSNVIPHMFFEMAVNGFKTLHRIVSPNRAAFLTDKEWKMLDDILQACYEDTEPSYYIQSSCREEIWAVNKSSNLLCLGKMIVHDTSVPTTCYQTNIDVFDPLLDVIWLMFEGVKANCFNRFQGNSRLFHRYSLAIMDLYTRPLKFRWPLQNKDNVFWERILGPNLDLHLRNLDKCVHHIVDISPLDFRTPRFLNIHTVRLSHTVVDAMLS